MACIGSVIFAQDLRWIPKNEDVVVRGSDIPTRGGIVSQRMPPSQEEFRTYRFGRITHYDWILLKRMAESGATYNFTPENGGAPFPVRFARQNAVRIIEQDGHNEEILAGEIRLIVLRR